MTMPAASRSGFTLTEVAIAIAVLIVGLTGSISVFIMGVSWANEIKVKLTAFDAAQTVLVDPGILATVESPRPPVPPTPEPGDDEVRGFLHGYYFVRTVETSQSVDIPSGGGRLLRIRVVGYHGGDDSSGQRVVDCSNLLRVEP
jgi:prepilin-type N-terminal cleavage/methylation domain-containing protein